MLLQKYLEFKRVPRVLRITKLCSFLDDDLKDKWISRLHECNRSWLQYIITQRERNLVKIRADINTLQEDLSLFLDVTTFDAWYLKNNEQMMVYETNLISKKSGKFERDRLDYLNDREFSWKKPKTSSDKALGSNDSKKRSSTGSNTNKNKNKNRNLNRKHHIMYEPKHSTLPSQVPPTFQPQFTTSMNGSGDAKNSQSNNRTNLIPSTKSTEGTTKGTISTFY